MVACFLVLFFTGKVVVLEMRVLERLLFFDSAKDPSIFKGNLSYSTLSMNSFTLLTLSTYTI